MKIPNIKKEKPIKNILLIDKKCKQENNRFNIRIFIPIL